MLSYSLYQIVSVILVLIVIVKTEPPSNYGVPHYNNGPYSASHGGGGYSGHSGYGDDHYENNEPKSYEFGYAVKDDYTGADYGRKESSDGHTVHGEYRVNLPDGRVQIVTYYADWQTGFHADVRYEGEAVYPTNYKTYGAPQQYGAPSNNNGYSSYNNGNHYSSSTNSHPGY